MIPANVSLGALLDENKWLRAENADLRADVEAFRPLWSSPFARPERWTTEPNPHPRSYVSTQQAQQDYADSIRCSSDWPPEKRHEAMDRALGRIPDLAYEIEYLRAELARRDEQITAVRALCDRLLAQKGWRGVLNMAALHVPTASAHEILAALDGGAS